MKEYFYMFSSGEYSDYCVGGMYKSKTELTEDYFAKYLKAKMIEQVPEAEEFFLGLETSLPELTGYSISENLYVYCTKDEQIPYNQLTTGEYSQLNTARYGRKTEWIKSKGFTQDFVSLLVQDGILEEVEYEEIWRG